MTDTAIFARHRPYSQLFSGSCVAFWATTYNLWLPLFNEFLLPRLGDPPLNAVVMADRRHLDSTLDRIPAERVASLTNTNTRWLLRGCQIGTGRFHPKSYLSLTPTRATLLVGSGNLTASGLDEGREVFAAFESGTPEGDAAIVTWAAWMERLVTLLADAALAGRYRDLLVRLPKAHALTEVVPSPLLHNLDEPLLSQLVRTVGDGPVLELMLTAPYYDPDVRALALLIERLAPQRVTLYTTSSTEVDGGRLRERLEQSGAKVALYRYEPDRFTHAKLIGVITRGGGWLLSGSANLSNAALINTAGSGNVELAVLTAQPADEVRATFVPPGATTAELNLTDLESLEYTPDPEAGPRQVRLSQAVRTPDGRVTIRSEPAPDGSWLLHDLVTEHSLTLLEEGAMTKEAVAGLLVFLVDAEGAVLSNRLVVDDPVALTTMLSASERRQVDRPEELYAGDVSTPLGKALVWLHRNLAMDVNDLTGARGGPPGPEGAEEPGEDLWDRLEREQLGRDPRGATYGRLLLRAGSMPMSDPIVGLLEAMRDRVPNLDPKVLGGGGTVIDLFPPLDEPPPQHRWAAAARIRVRAQNVLRRWAGAQSDPRLSWVNPFAPLGNLVAVATVLFELRLAVAADPKKCELTSEDLDELWLLWLRAFAGTGNQDGWYDRTEVSPLQLAERTPTDFPALTATLCWLSIVKGQGQRERFVLWQPVLRAAVAHELVAPTKVSADLISRIGMIVDVAQVTDDLRKCMDFIDDELWAELTMKELDLPTLSLEAVSAAQEVELRVRVSGILDPLEDARVPRLIAAARHYRGCDAIAVFSDDVDWRLAIATGHDIALRPGKGTARPDLGVTPPVAEGMLETLVADGGVLSELFSRSKTA